MNHLDQQSSVFIVRLTQDQRVFINSILGRGYSLQPSHPNSVGPKNAYVRKGQVNYKQESMQEKDQENSKRRKVKSYQLLDQDQIKPSPRKGDELAKMAGIVKKLKKNDSSWPFRHPVDAKALSIPNYNEIVLVPMDLQTIEERLRTEKYKHSSEIERDINQMLLNSYKFNAKGGQYFEATSKLEQYYQNLLNDNEEGSTKKEMPARQKAKEQPQSKAPENEKPHQIVQFQKDLMNLLKKANEMSCNHRKVRQKPVYVSSKHDGPISIKEKRELALEIKSLDEIHLGRVVEIVKQNNKEMGAEDHRNQILGIDIEKLDNKTIRELQNYVRLQKNSIIHDKEESGLDSQENNYSFC